MICSRTLICRSSHKLERALKGAPKVALPLPIVACDAGKNLVVKTKRAPGRPGNVRTTIAPRRVAHRTSTKADPVAGAADAVAQALATFEFCPGCVDETYALTFALDDVSCGICTVAGVSHDLKIKATTQLAHVFHGRVV